LTEWWENISLLEQIFVLIAAPSTLILIIQTIMLLFGGFEDASSYENADFAEGDPEIEQTDTDGLRLLSVRGIMTFLTVFGWSGVIMMGMGLHPAIAAAVSGLLGFAALYGMALMTRGLMKLQESGNPDYRRALGKTAQVYITIPPAGQGQGKINLILGDALREFWAVTEREEPIPPGTMVRIVDLDGIVFTVE
jgi:membrane protein implicated in regulation of membrane protease activity